IKLNLGEKILKIFIVQFHVISEILNSTLLEKLGIMHSWEICREFQILETFSNRLSVVFSRTLASAGKELKDNFLKALAEREEANRSGKMTVSTLLQHSNCYVMGFPSNISAIPLGWEQNPYCVKLSGNALPSSFLNTMRPGCLPVSDP
uniref:Uncharacterized protein n=1 Tax=Pundamilia nyererei TaxID=303518 RepID=A0A3B4FCR3_9CICH